MLVVRDKPTLWGEREIAPDYATVTVTDAPAAQIEPFLASWRWDYGFVSNVNPDQSESLDVGINDRIPNATGLAMSTEMRDAVVAKYPTTSWSTWGLTAAMLEITRVDRVNTGDIIDLIDNFDETLGVQYYFEDAEVDRIIGAGYSSTMNFAAFQAVMFDRSKDTVT